MKDRYITAILSLLREHHDAVSVIAGVRDVLTKRNHERLFPSIMRGVLRRLEDSVSGAEATVVVASEAELARNKEVIAKLLTSLEAKDEPRVVIDDSLIGGIIVSNNYQRIDTSYKRALASLYERVTQ
ncbi:F0F1 ATP synthase subunit delta [Patescibacteria group bacterium]|nr:F0F1 ATP synthase subunit delta [Patescibacteria group bacterium]